ncbi:MAG: SiaB family protein kinase [Pelosinus sp.]|nr:SiaB family protein kinase [Pelosinus sp.]
MENNLDLIELQKTLRDSGVLITFSGRFTQEIIEELGEAVKKYLETDATSLNDTYNVFSVFIEQTQNIRNYTVKQAGSPLAEQIANSGVLVIGKLNTGYFVSSGNLVAAPDVEPLVSQLEEIKLQDKAGLRKMYKEKLRKKLPEGSSSAGLGLIDMARKACQELNYSIVKVDEEVCFFSLQVRV